MNTETVINKEDLIYNSIRYIIHRFELNNSILPTYYIVGFKILCELNQREVYIETMVDYLDCKDKSDNEICLLAYNQLKNKIDDVSKELLSKKFILGSEFIPPKN
jgi:hypothetical protein